MIALPETKVLADGVRAIYQQNPANAPAAIDAYLGQQLMGSSTEQKRQMAENLALYFKQPQPKSEQPSSFGDEQFIRFCSLLLGYPVQETDLADENLQQRLTAALTTIFETLNQLIRTINLTLLEDGQTQETIRALIGERLGGNSDGASLKGHLDQIRTAFVSSHRAFKAAMRITIEKILTELDPEVQAEKDGGGFKFNPLRRADGRKRYEQTYKECRQWFDSGRCMEEFLRAFEKQCAATAQNTKEGKP